MEKVSVEQFFNILRGFEIPLPDRLGQSPHGAMPLGDLLTGSSAIDLVNALSSDDFSEILEANPLTSESKMVDRVQNPIAWYLPYHFEEDRWGIFISTSAIEQYAINLWRALVSKDILTENAEGLSNAIKLALVSIEGHERFHHRVENMVSRQEVLAEMGFYTKDVFKKLRKVGIDPKSTGRPKLSASELEEALCNAHGASLHVLRRARTGLDDAVLDQVSEAIHELDSGLTGGYQHGSEFRTNQDMKFGQSGLIEGYLRARYVSKSHQLRRDILRPLELPISGLKKPTFLNDGGILGKAVSEIHLFSQKLNGQLNETRLRNLIDNLFTTNGWNLDIKTQLVIDDAFLPSVNKMRVKDKNIQASIIRCCARCLHDISKVSGHHVTGKKKKIIKNSRGQTAQRRYVKNVSPQAPRLHAWHGGTPKLILLNVAMHDDYSAFDSFDI